MFKISVLLMVITNISLVLTTPPTSTTTIPTITSTSDVYCSNGTQSTGGKFCCLKSCGTCGGVSCNTFPGGENNCCTNKIKRSCLNYPAPCVRDIQPIKTCNASISSFIKSIDMNLSKVQNNCTQTTFLMVVLMYLNIDTNTLDNTVNRDITTLNQVMNNKTMQTYYTNLFVTNLIEFFVLANGTLTIR